MNRKWYTSTEGAQSIAVVREQSERNGKSEKGIVGGTQVALATQSIDGNREQRERNGKRGT